MKKFDENYELLAAMYRDGYFPDFLVDKIKELVQNVISVLENGESNFKEIQNKFDEMTLAINDLQEEFGCCTSILIRAIPQAEPAVCGNKVIRGK